MSWFVTPHAQAEVNCPAKYVIVYAYPGDPQCVRQAPTAPFGLGDFGCTNLDEITAYCGSPSAGDTNEPVAPEGVANQDGDGVDGQPGKANGCGGDSANSSAGCGSSDSSGDPVRLYTGQFHLAAHDLHVADTIPLDLARVYRSSAYDTSGRPMAGAFGIGTTFNYDSYLVVAAADASGARPLVQLYLPSGTRIPYTLRAGTSATWDDLTSPGEYYRASITDTGTAKVLTLRDGRVRQFTMIAGFYRLTRVQDRNGNSVVIARDITTGAVTSITSPGGRALKFASITGSRGTPLVSSVSDPLNRKVAYQYDSQDRLILVTDAAGGTWKYGWDTKSRLVSVTDPEGNSQVVNTYDDSDRVVAQKLADGSTFAMAYTVASGKVSQVDVTDRRGSVRRVEFDANGRVVRNTYPAGQPAQQVQTFTYDANGRTTNLTVLDRQYTFGYDGNGNRITEADQSGTLVTRTFDSYSRLLTEAQAGDTQRGVATVYTYDTKGNLLTVTDRLGNRTTYTNDSQGRVLTVTDALKGATTYTWTGPDLTSITDPLSRTTQFTTDAVGRVVAVKDALGNTTRRTPDALDRTTDVTDALGGVTRFTWDRNGHLLSQADAKGVATRYTYNAIGRPVSKTDALGHSEIYTWNSAGQLASLTDRKGQLTSYNYAADGQIGTVYFSSGPGAKPSRSWSYGRDTYGRLQGGGDTADGQPSHATYRYYDSVTGYFDGWFENASQQGTVWLRFAADSRDLSRIETKDATASYSRDAEHRVTQIQYQVNNDAPLTFNYTYDALGRRSQATLANGITATYAWDAASQLTGITYRRADGSVLGDLTYGYDLAGRRTKAGGSLAKVDLPQAVSDAQYNEANQLTRWGGNTFTYDLNGNLASDGVNQYGWNAQNLLAQISGATAASFIYDMEGRRREQTVNGHRLQSFWIGDELSFSIRDNDWDHRIRQFSPYPESGLDELTYRRIGDDASGDRFVLRDANNNVIALTDANQQSQTQYTYQPYGVTTQTGAADVNTQQYTGRENDGTGLYYYRNRYYSPATARFISEDPIGWASGQTNAYAYVGGNPVSYSDPTGLQWWAPTTPPPWVAGGVFNNGTRPPPGSMPIDQTPWSGDHGGIKGSIGARGDDNVKISPNGDVWGENPDGSWTNHGAASDFTGSGKASGRKGKDREGSKGRDRCDF